MFLDWNGFCNVVGRLVDVSEEDMNYIEFWVEWRE